jgi:hypothetical protein
MSAVELPITLRTSRTRALLLLAGSLTFVGCGLWFSVDHPVIGYGNVVFFGLCALVALALLLPGSSFITLNREGFLFASLFRKHEVRWQDVVEFRTIRVGLNTMVGWNYAGAANAHATLRSVNQALSGVDAALPDIYGMRADDLATLLETIRAQQAGEGF